LPRCSGEILEASDKVAILSTTGMNLLRRVVLFIIALLAPFAAFGQDTFGLASRVEAVSYPTLPRQARIQGDVRLRSGPDGVTVISGHPLLAPTAVKSLKELGKLSQGEIEAIYHFAFVDPVIRVTTRVERRGNRFERLVLHAFMMKTERVVEYPECTQTPVSKNRAELNGNRLEVWIYASAGCVQTLTSQIALNGGIAPDCSVSTHEIK
jgi:hypothetical protein